MMKWVRERRFQIWLFTSLWAMALVGGFYGLTRYQLTPGAMRVEAEWPGGLSIPFQTGRPNLILFLHPRCNCSRATLTELKNLLTQAKSPVHLRIFVFQPIGEKPDWSQSDLWQMAQNISDAEVQMDWGGKLARQFGALTSGTAILYAEDKHAIFRGGLTASRGHLGPSLGQESILAYLAHEPVRVAEAKTFGCAINRRDDRHSKGGT